jgi:trimethylamine--corrinoid protein Co-methyltransferase
MSIGSGQLARHIGLPWRSAAGAAFNTNDMQATHETVMSLWGCLQANATMVIHSAGWLEGGLTFGFEKFIQDIEALQSIAHLCKPVPSDASAIGLDAIAQVAPGGHFFATDQTMAQYSSVFCHRSMQICQISVRGPRTAPSPPRNAPQKNGNR